MSEEEPRVCVTCRYYKGPQNEYVQRMHPQHEEPQCGHPKAHSRDLVNGRALCRTERNDNKGCGRSGKLWALPATEKKN